MYLAQSIVGTVAQISVGNNIEPYIPQEAGDALIKSMLPAHAAHNYRAAVQSNWVYLTPCTTVSSINFEVASDKRYSLGSKQ